MDDVTAALQGLNLKGQGGAADTIKAVMWMVSDKLALSLMDVQMARNEAIRWDT